MKKLILPLAVLFITMSSFTNNTVIVEDIAPCYDLCDDFANSQGGTYEEEFETFAVCYDTICEGGEVVFE